MLEEELFEPVEDNIEQSEIVVEELPVEDLPEELVEDPAELTEEPAELLEEPDELAEEHAELIEETTHNEEINQTENIQVTPTPGSEEILYHVEEIDKAVGIIEINCKTGIENLQLISTCSLGINCLMFGGFVIFCFVNRLG